MCDCAYYLNNMNVSKQLAEWKQKSYCHTEKKLSCNNDLEFPNEFNVKTKWMRIVDGYMTKKDKILLMRNDFTI